MYFDHESLVFFFFRSSWKEKNEIEEKEIRKKKYELESSHQTLIFISIGFQVYFGIHKTVCRGFY